MNIGIVTFWSSEDNYGEVLQAVALYKYLESRGHRCFIVKYSEERNSSFVSRLFTLIGLMGNPAKLVARIRRSCRQSDPLLNRRSDPSHAQQTRRFSEFRDRWLRFSKEYSHSELKHDPPAAEAFVCGSDQIWGGLDTVMYLSFVPARCKKIAFAPSFGGLNPNFYVRCKIRKYIESFDFVSCRENSGVELCRALGRDDACLFPDPTMMHRADFYDAVVSQAPVAPKCGGKPYIFAYLLGNRMDFDVQEVYVFARRKGLNVVLVTGQNGAFADMESCPATVEEWLDGIANAEYVVTNSFHGTMFSLIYHRKFLTLPLVGIHSRMKVRITELLDKSGLSERIYRDSFDIIEDDIDFSTFDRMQSECIGRVNDALKDIL